MKHCNKCLTEKPLEDFPKLSKSPDGRNVTCKKCAVIATQARQKTPKGLIKKIYHNQIMITGKNGRTPPDYTEEELYEWAMQRNYMKLWQAWTDAGHPKELSPSFDRLDNNISYTLSNLQLVTFAQNLSNQKTMNMDGTYLHTGSKSVKQFTLDGVFVAEHTSIAIAMRALTGKRGSVSNISNVCNGKWPTAYGYKWEWS